MPNSKFGKDGEEPQRQGTPAQPLLPPIPQYPTHEDYTRAMAESPLAGLFQIPGNLAMKACSAKVTAPTPAITAKHTDHSEPLNCHKCKDFFVKYTDIDRLELEQKSKEKSDSKL